MIVQFLALWPRRILSKWKMENEEKKDSITAIEAGEEKAIKKPSRLPAFLLLHHMASR